MTSRSFLPLPGMVFAVLLVGGSVVANVLLLLRLGSMGLALEIALCVWARYFDKVAFNGHGRPYLFLRRGWWWKDFRKYFPVTLHQEAQFDSSKRYLFVIHPHGVIGCSSWLTFAADTVGFSQKNHNLDIAIATIHSNFFLPFWRDLLLGIGFIDASFRSLKAALKLNRSVAVVLGGAAETLDAHPGTNNITLKKRKGIFRLALRTGAPVVPVFVFGENDLFYQAPNCKGSLLRKLQELVLSKFKFSPPIIMGTGWFGCPVGICPRDIPLHVVVGIPISVPHMDNPSEEDVAKYHKRFQNALESLYAKHEKHYYMEILPQHLQSQSRPILQVVA